MPLALVPVSLTSSVARWRSTVGSTRSLWCSVTTTLWSQSRTLDHSVATSCT